MRLAITRLLENPVIGYSQGTPPAVEEHRIAKVMSPSHMPAADTSVSAKSAFLGLLSGCIYFTQVRIPRNHERQATPSPTVDTIRGCTYP